MFSLAFLVFCNGSGVVFMLAIVAVNWLIARLCAGQLLCPLLTWLFNAAILLANERYHGYRFHDILGVSYGQSTDACLITVAITLHLCTLHSLSARAPLSLSCPDHVVWRGVCVCVCVCGVVWCGVVCCAVTWRGVVGWLDGYRGLFGWETLFNLVVLRMISYNLDYHWAVAARAAPSSSSSSSSSSTTSSSSSSSPSPSSPHGTPSPPHGPPVTFAAHRASCLDCSRRGSSSSPCLSWREKEGHPVVEYSALCYFVYVFYVPLHFAGPIVTFNSFISHLHRPHGIAASALVVYAVRLLLCMALLEVGLHYLYVSSAAHIIARMLGYLPNHCTQQTALFHMAHWWSGSSQSTTDEEKRRCEFFDDHMEGLYDDDPIWPYSHCRLFGHCTTPLAPGSLPASLRFLQFGDAFAQPFQPTPSPPRCCSCSSALRSASAPSWLSCLRLWVTWCCLGRGREWMGRSSSWTRTARSGVRAAGRSAS